MLLALRKEGHSEIPHGRHGVMVISTELHEPDVDRPTLKRFFFLVLSPRTIDVREVAHHSSNLFTFVFVEELRCLGEECFENCTSPSHVVTSDQPDSAIIDGIDGRNS